MLDDLLIAVRVIHFAATTIVAGTTVFSILIAEPAQDSAGSRNWLRGFHNRIGHLLWFCLIASVASGVVRLVLVAADIANEGWREVLTDGMVWMVLTNTQFGVVSQIRLLLATLLGALLLVSRHQKDRPQRRLRILSTAVALLLLGSLAWTGHAAAGTGIGGSVHLVSDALHILAAGIWIGGLIGLALLMAQLRRSPDSGRLRMCNQVLRRFSSLGVVCVAALMLSGVVNTWFLTDHLRAVIGTAYGQLVLIKIALFLVMVSLAADNRLRLLPRLSPDGDNSSLQTPLRRLRQNIALEIALGLAVLYVVALLGVTPPPAHRH